MIMDTLIQQKNSTPSLKYTISKECAIRKLRTLLINRELYYSFELELSKKEMFEHKTFDEIIGDLYDQGTLEDAILSFFIWPTSDLGKWVQANYAWEKTIIRFTK